MSPRAPGQISLLEHLKTLHWSRGAEASALFTQHGIRHGVLGRSTPDFRLAELLPHHATQVHGTDMVVASNLTLYDSTDRPAADAIMTTEYRVLAVRTADCLPILLATSDGQWVAAVHAGWRGFSRGILSKTLELAAQLNPKKTLLAMIGPSISRERFEVGPEVLDALRSADTRLSDAAFNLCVAKGLGDRWHVDLSLAAACQLLEYDIDPNSIEVMQSCTYQDTQGHHHRWHSYRRDGRNCGSNWTWIQGPQA